jgi:pyrimidine deaminase RibD-like protein
MHAEEAALYEAGESAKGAVLYTLMIKKTGIGNGHPCPECMIRIAEAGIRKIILYV